MEKKLPLYKLTISDDTNADLLVSFVANPAIKIKGFAFEDIIKMYFSKDQQVVAGPVLIPDMLIYRNDPEMGEYNVMFSAEDILKIRDRILLMNDNKLINIDHSNKMTPSHIQSMWITTGDQYERSKSYGFNLPEGSLFFEVKVTDTQFWNEEIIHNEKNAFSIEGLFSMMKINLSEIIKNKNEIQMNEELIKLIQDSIKVALNAPVEAAIDAPIDQPSGPSMEEAIALINELASRLADLEAQVATLTTEEVTEPSDEPVAMAEAPIALEEVVPESIIVPAPIVTKSENFNATITFLRNN